MNGKLSTNILGEKHSILGKEQDIFALMPKTEIETLQDYVQSVFKETPGLTEDKASERAARQGFKISAGYVGAIRRGVYKDLTIPKLKALAAALGRDEDEVIDIARGKSRTEDEALEGRIAILFQRAKALNAEDLIWFNQTLEMLDRELDRREQIQSGKRGGKKKR
jgi:transcriptional regulator with XRE-family HTH domain